MKCKCSAEIPQGRLNLGYKTCINCSTTARYACVPITNHKPVIQYSLSAKKLLTLFTKQADAKVMVPACASILAETAF